MKPKNEVLKTWNRFFVSMGIVVAASSIVSPLVSGNRDSLLLVYGTIGTMIFMSLATLAAYVIIGEESNQNGNNGSF